MERSAECINSVKIIDLSSGVEPLDGHVILLQHHVALHLERGAQLAAGHAEVLVEERPLLDALRVGRGLPVGAVHARLNEENPGMMRYLGFFTTLQLIQ